MPTAQDVFPKIGNDPLFDSEVNSFRLAGGWATAGSFPQISSGTNAGSILGSILVPANTFPNWTKCDINFQYDQSNNNNSIGIIFSGTYAGNGPTKFAAGSSLTTTTKIGRATINVGSPWNSQGYLIVTKGSQNTNLDAFERRETTQSFTDIYTGSQFIIFFSIADSNGDPNTAQGNISMSSYHLSALRGTIK